MLKESIERFELYTDWATDRGCDYVVFGLKILSVFLVGITIVVFIFGLGLKGYLTLQQWGKLREANTKLEAEIEGTKIQAITKQVVTNSQNAQKLANAYNLMNKRVKRLEVVTFSEMEDLKERSNADEVKPEAPKQKSE